MNRNLPKVKQTLLEYHYTSPDYFYNYEEEEEEEEYDDIIDSHREMSVNKPQKYMDANNMIISDDPYYSLKLTTKSGQEFLLQFGPDE